MADIIRTFAYAFLALLCAWFLGSDIKEAITHFKEKEYGFFGMNMVLVAMWSVNLVRSMVYMFR